MLRYLSSTHKRKLLNDTKINLKRFVNSVVLLQRTKYIVNNIMYEKKNAIYLLESKQLENWVKLNSISKYEINIGISSS